MRSPVPGYVVSVILVGIGVGLLTYPLSTAWRYTAAQSRMAEAFAATVETSDTPAATDTVPADPAVAVPAAGEPVAKLTIPKLGLDTIVLSGTGRSVLKSGPGHYRETPLPGEPGNSAIAGHRTMYGQPFRYLDKLSEGDEIVALTRAGRFVYKVVEVKSVLPTDVSVIDPTDETFLTLTACDPPGSAARRLVVKARLSD